MEFKRVDFDCYILSGFTSVSPVWVWGYHAFHVKNAFCALENAKADLQEYRGRNIYLKNIYIQSHDDLIKFKLMVGDIVEFKVQEFKYEPDGLGFYYNVKSDDIF